MKAELDADEALLGPDAHADGLEPYRAGTTGRRVTPEERFAECLKA